jgi:uncharacterized protein YjgD (DUF1641 family)
MEIKEYYNKIKELQLDGTLNKIREEIRLHDKYEIAKRYQDSHYKMQTIHFLDRLMILLDADPKLGDQISYYYWELLVKDKEFRKSKDEYDNYVKDIELSERKEMFSGITTTKETVQEARDLIEKFLKNL